MQSDREIFFAALDIEDARGRDLFLDAACSGDSGMRSRVDALLANHFAEDDFMLANAAPEVPRSEEAAEGPGAIIGRYKLLEKIGEGGVGDVYVAEQREPVKRKVALKVIKLGMDTRQVVARFEMERQALAMMDHPNIAKALDAGATESGRPYFIMELVRGVRITQFCNENRLTTAERLRLFAQVCNAVQHAHQKGIIHRDLKPSNILVTLHDGVAMPKVIDFGIAKATAGELTDKTIYTQFQQFIGTPAYMSPEQAEMSGLDIDTRTDIYSLGVLLYELLTGSTPFDAKQLATAGIDELRKTIRETDAVRPSTRLATLAGAALTTAASERRVEAMKLPGLLRGDLDWIVMKCLEKDRTRRYATVQDLSSDILRHLNNEPILARPPTTAYRLQKAWRRNRLVLSSLATLTVILLAAVAVSTWQAVVATRAEASAIKSQKTEQEARLQADAEKKTAERNLYAANMSLVPQAWEQHDLWRVRQLLDEMREYPERGFEWFYWKKRLHEAIATLRGHILEVKSATFSHDGARVVTGGSEGAAIIWNVETGQESLRLANHTAPVMTAAWSPDDRWVATVSHDHFARIWDANTGKELLSLSAKARLECGAFSPDGKILAAGDSEGGAHFWALPSGEEVLTIPAHAEAIFGAAFSADGRFFGTASIDGLAKVFERQTGRLVSTLSGHKDWVRSIEFSRDGSRVLTASDDSTVRIWDSATGAESKVFTGHTFYVSAAAFSPDETLIASASTDWTLKLWDVRDGREVATFKAPSALNSAHFSPDGHRIVTAAADLTALIWNLRDDSERVYLPGGKAVSELYARAFSGDGQRAATADVDHRIHIAECATGREILGFQAHQGAILSLAFSKDDRRVLSGSLDRSARIWDAFSGREMMAFKAAGGIASAVFSPDEKYVLTGGRDAVVRLWNAASGEEIRVFNGHTEEVSSVAFSPDGTKIVSGARDGKAIVWETASGRQLSVLNLPNYASWWVAWSPDGRKIATGGLDRSARVWDAASGKLLFTLDGHSAWIWTVGFSPDSRRIFTGSFDRTARLWDSENGREVLNLREAIRAARFTADGGEFVVAGDRNMRVISGARREEIAEAMRLDQAALARVAQRTAEAEAARGKAMAERDADPGLIKDWLIAAPIWLPNGMASSNGVWHAFVANENQLNPASGDRLADAYPEVHWLPYHMTDLGIDLNRFIRQNSSLAVAYCVARVAADTELTNVRMLVGSDDHSRVYVNGEEVYHFAGKRYFIPDEDAVSNLRLHAGTNVIVFKVVNHSSEWKGGIRLREGGGGPLQGVRILPPK